MNVYHGTVAHNVEGIKAEGLKPNPSEAFRVNRGIISKEDAVYVSTEMDLAKDMAQYRSQYDQADPGERFGDNFFQEFYKRPEAPPKHVGLDETPVVVEFKLPDELADKLETDPGFLFTTVAKMFFGTIPGEYITAVHKEGE